MNKTQKHRILGCFPAKKVEKTEKEIALGQTSFGAIKRTTCDLRRKVM